MAFGFLTFGRGCRGLVLDSYAVADGLAVWARLANLVSVLAGYPLYYIVLYHIISCYNIHIYICIHIIILCYVMLC